VNLVSTSDGNRSSGSDQSSGTVDGELCRLVDPRNSHYEISNPVTWNFTSVDEARAVIVSAASMRVLNSMMVVSLPLTVDPLARSTPPAVMVNVAFVDPVLLMMNVVINVCVADGTVYNVALLVEAAPLYRTVNVFAILSP
jgi:hypothetical protein